ncbi:MAG: peptidoglycan-binding protein [Pseudomonadota bacterium]
MRFRAAAVGLAAGLAVTPALGQVMDSPYAIRDPLDREYSPYAQADELAIGDEEPLTPAAALGIERELASLGYSPGVVDGVIDQQTRGAIRAFQADEGLRATGEPTAELFRRLRLSAVAPEPGPVPGDRIEVWRRDLVGKQVYGEDTGEVGEVVDLIVGADNRISGVVVAVEGLGGVDVARVPVPWEWVDHQIGRPTVVLPWSRADVEWLLAEGSGMAAADVGGWKTSWLDGTEAELAAGGVFGTVEGFVFNRIGEVESIVVRRAEGGRFYEVPRRWVRVEQEPVRVVITAPAPQVLALQPRITRDPAPALRPLEETPDRIASPERERIERDLAVDLARWENRIDRVALELGDEDPEVRALRDAFRAAKQNWQALVQTGGPNWETKRIHFAAAMDDLRSRWGEVAQAVE